MSSNTHTPEKFVFSQNKDRLKDLFKTQEKTIFHFLQHHTATASMVSKETGIPQKNICRYKRDLEQRNLLFEVEKKLCKVTGFRAYYLSTNPNLKKI